MFPAPTLLRESLQRVKDLHPYAASGRIARGARADADSSKIWERLLGASGSQLDELIGSLTSHELALVGYGARARLADEVSLTVFRRVIELRPEARMAPIAWDAFLVVKNGDTVFRDAAEPYITKNADIRAWRLLHKSHAPLRDAAGLFLASKFKVLEKWLESDDVRLDRKSVFKRLLQRELLSPETVLLVITHVGINVVDEWLEAAFDGNERVEWFQSYLISTAPKGWQLKDPILIRIIDRFRAPEERRGFWNSVPQGVVDAVECWLRNVQLTRLLGEGERVAFWRRYLAQMRQSIATPTRDAVFVCFDKWFAVQFVESGRATYMFRSSHLGKMRRLDGHKLYREVLDSPALGSYEHRGDYWEGRASQVVNRILTAGSK